MMSKTGVALICLTGACSAVHVPSALAPTPPMGWMSWEKFRCEVDCVSNPTACINEKLYMDMTERIAADGYLAAGYQTVSIDDCWESMNPERDSSSKLAGNSTRFPSGMKALGDFMHAHGVNFGIYSDMGTKTCGGYPGSEGYEEIDAQTFADWGVDYLKLDGCYNDVAGFATGYPKMGSALRATGRDIVYSCSWPAYLGNNETTKPFDDMIAAGCNSWRNWDDIQDSWESMLSIIDHWGDYGEVLAGAAGPGHWNDMDMLLIGDTSLTLDEAETQMGLWSILASPLIMSNDLRSITAPMREILLNPEVIAVNQDVAGKQGRRLNKGDLEVWARELQDGSVAVGLFNKNGASGSTITVELADLFPSVALVSNTPLSAHSRDLFKRQDIGVAVKSFSASVAAHGLVLARLTPLTS